MRIVAIAFPALALAVALPAVALAHARPVRVTPGHGSVLAVSPALVEIETSEDMERTTGANELVVTDTSGRTVTTAPGTVEAANRRKLSAPLAPSLPTGDYTIRWKTLSAADGEADEGTFTFRVDPATTPLAGRSELALPTAVPPAAENGGGGGAHVVFIVAFAAGVAVVGAFAWFIFRPSHS